VGLQENKHEPDGAGHRDLLFLALNQPVYPELLQVKLGPPKSPIISLHRLLKHIFAVLHVLFSSS